MAGDAARIDAARAQVSLSALHAIATHLGGLSATRKTLLVITEGFAAPGRRRAAGALATIDSVIRSANRAIVSIYAVDPRPTPQDADDAGHQTLGRLTAETDGRAMLPAADLQAGLDQLLRDSSRYYLLTLQGASAGRFHPVTVRVRPRGLQVRARRGFWSASADELNRVRLAGRPETPAPPPLLPRRASPLIRPWFGVAPGPGGQPQVSFVWEPANRVPGDAAAARPARIRLKARTSDGTLIYEGAARAASPTPAVAGETPAQLSFSAPPGRLRVEMAIEDAAARLVDTDVRDVVVDAPRGPVALGTPRILRSRTAREHRALETDPDAVPTASRQFSRIERLWVRVAALAAAGPLQVSARLTSAIGGAMRELPVVAAPGDLYQIDLPLAGLPSGDYAVEFLAASGGAEVKEVVSFRVTP
jgi:hypothetical protein